MKSYTRPLKSFVLIISLTLMGGIIVSSCDMFGGEFLDEDPKGAVSEGILAERNGGPDAVLTGAYGALDGMTQTGAIGGGSDWAVAPDNWIYGIVGGGMAHKGSTLGDQGPILTIARMQHSASLGFFNDKWKAVYEGIDRSNAVLSVLSNAENLSDAERNRIAGQARFLRAHYYFDLKKNFGNVPWIDQASESFKVPNTGSDAVDVWNKIEEDFQYARENLPEESSQIGRANRWAAAAYLGKAHLYQEDWDEARSLFDEVIANGVNNQGEAYSLVPSFQDMFNPATENNSGTVFSIQQTGKDGSGTTNNSRQAYTLNWPHRPSPFGCCGFFQPSLWLVNSYRTGSDGLPTLDVDSGPIVKNDQGVTSSDHFSLGNQSLDPRLDWTVGRRGVPYHDWGPHPGRRWIREQGTGGPFSPKKHIFRRADRDQFGNDLGRGSAVNYPVIRFADVLLMAAEAEAEMGDLEQARQYVNRVRERAGNQSSEITNSLNTEFSLAVVNNEQDMLATNPSPFDWVVRTDQNSSFVFLGGDPSNINDWNEYEIPEYNVEPYPASEFNASQDAALERIRFERKLELAMEGHRFYDLARWGVADSQLDDYYNFETSNLVHDVDGGDFTTGKNEVYPIPQRQIDLSTAEGESVLEQNPGY